MTRRMFDGITPSAVPGGAAAYAGYVNGKWQSFEPLKAQYPGALHVSIAVNVSADARVLDVETGDATPEQAPGWATRQRQGGNPYPVIYMNESTWPAVRQAFADQKVEPPLYWVAAYVSDPSHVPPIPVGAIAIQYYDFGGYDASSIADYWPGLDPAPATPTPPAQLEEDEDMKASAMAQNGVAMIGFAAGDESTVEFGTDPQFLSKSPTFRAVVLMNGKKPYAVAENVKLDDTGTYVVHIPAELVSSSRILAIYCSDPAVPYVMYVQ